MKFDYSCAGWLYEEDGKLCKVIPKARHRHWFNSPYIHDHDKKKWYDLYRKRFNDHPNFIAIDYFELPNYFEMKKINGCTLYHKLDRLLVNQAAKRYGTNLQSEFIDEDEKKVISNIFKQYKNMINHILSFQDNFLHLDLWGYNNVMVESETNRLILIDPDSVFWVREKEIHHIKAMMYKNLADIKRIELFIINNDINISWKRLRHGYLPDGYNEKAVPI